MVKIRAKKFIIELKSHKIILLVYIGNIEIIHNKKGGGMEEDNSGKVGLIVASVLIGGILLIAGFFLLGYMGMMGLEKERRGP